MRPPFPAGLERRSKLATRETGVFAGESARHVDQELFHPQIANRASRPVQAALTGEFAFCLRVRPSLRRIGEVSENPWTLADFHPVVVGQRFCPSEQEAVVAPERIRIALESNEKPANTVGSPCAGLLRLSEQEGRL
jgi:hypothetical protein